MRLKMNEQFEHTRKQYLHNMLQLLIHSTTDKPTYLGISGAQHIVQSMDRTNEQAIE